MEQRSFNNCEDRYNVVHALAADDGVAACAADWTALSSSNAAQSISNDAANLAANGIVMITDGSALSWITVNSVVAHYGPIDLIIEPPEPRSLFVRRRIRMLGPVTVFGQLAFAALQKVIKARSRERLRQIVESHDLSITPNPVARVHKVPNVNSGVCRKILRRLDPKVVFVHGARIIKTQTLHCVDVPFVNIHAGINPAYRGQHGAYWARANNDGANAGVTVHLIDEGVDTGRILYQERIEAQRADNITTYQFLQTATALPLVRRAIDDALRGALKPRQVALPSRQWFHPTLWGYLYAGLVHRVW